MKTHLRTSCAVDNEDFINLDVDDEYSEGIARLTVCVNGRNSDGLPFVVLTRNDARKLGKRLVRLAATLP